MTGPHFDLVIFDCDGVLVDSEVISAETLVDALAEKDISIDTDYIYSNFTGTSFPKVAQQLTDTFGATIDDAFVTDYRARLRDAFIARLQPTDGVKEVLGKLTCAKCVATSSSPTRVSRSLSVTGLTGYFGDHTFTASQVPQGKPAPDLFLLAAKTMGAKPANCLVIEDTSVGLQAARAAGMQALFYTGGTHLAGRDNALPVAMSDIPRFDKWADFDQIVRGFDR